MDDNEAAPVNMTAIAPAAADNGVAALLDLLDAPAAPSSEALPPAAKLAVAVAAGPVSSPAPGVLAPEEQPAPSGEHFMAWLRQGIQSHRLIINDAKALVHTVNGTAYLVSPGVFQRYAQEHLQVAVLARQEKLEGWQWVQKRFEKQGLHRKQASGLNIWTCEVTGPRKSRRLHGYLLVGADALFQELPPDNPYLRLLNEAAKRENSLSGDNNNGD